MDDMKRKELMHKNPEADSLSESDRLYSEDGVDLSLIRWMLSMTPTERLQTLQQNIRSVMRLRGAKANSRFLGNPKDSVNESPITSNEHEQRRNNIREAG